MSIYGATIAWRWWGIARADENITRKSFGFGQGGKCVHRREGNTLEKVLLYFIIYFMETD